MLNKQRRLFDDGTKIILKNPQSSNIADARARLVMAETTHRGNGKIYECGAEISASVVGARKKS